MDYYPDQIHILDSTTIRRERMLPERAVGSVEVREGETVNLREIVARGLLPSRYVVLDAVEFFHLKKPDDLAELMRVEVGAAVDSKTLLAGRSETRGKRLFSPVDGIVTSIDEGRIIVQVSPEEIEVEAGLDGQILEVVPGRGIVIETFGALVQGVWGNGKQAIGVLKLEPEDGIESLAGGDLDIQYRGAIVVTRRPLRTAGLHMIEGQNLEGIIAPSMEAGLIDEAKSANGAIMLTEGFGAIRMSTTVFNLLNGFSNRQASLDAATPSRWESRRPEVIINPSSRASTRPPRPDVNLTLLPGTTVRLTRPPNDGQVGKIVNLPKTPNLLENGLRVMCAQVELVTGEKVMIPLANLEVFGR
jgi:hypothetical protein